MVADLDVTIGRTVKQLRRDLGLTQAEVAEAVSLHQTALSKIESGKRPLLVSEAFALSDALPVNVLSVLAGAWTPTFADAYRAGYEKALDDVTHTITTMR